MQWVLECREGISQSGVQAPLGSTRSFQGLCEIKTIFLILLRIYLPLWYVISHTKKMVAEADIRILLSSLKLSIKGIFRMENNATFITIFLFLKIIIFIKCLCLHVMSLLFLNKLTHTNLNFFQT